MQRKAQTRLPLFVFQKGNLRASDETRREDFFSIDCEAAETTEEQGNMNAKKKIWDFD